MWKSILRSVITVAIYFLIVKLFSLLFEFVLVREEFLNINEASLYFIDTIVYVILIILAFLFIKKWDGKIVRKGNITLKNIVLILIITIVYRFSEDPLLRIGVINGSENIPLINESASIDIVKYISLLLNIVFLAAIFEELLFRRIILNFFTSKYLFLGILVSSILFALIHIKGSHIDYTILFSAFLLGVLACVICIRYGLFYSILLHIGYNFIWLLLQRNKAEYWDILQELNFGIAYWLITIMSFGVIAFLVYRNVKYIRQSLSEEL